MRHSARTTVAAALALAAVLPIAGAASAQECDKPNMLIVLDASGSMSGQKWTDAKNAVSFILSNYGSTIRWGLMLFASDGSCAAGVIDVGVGDNTAATINTTIANNFKNSNTPTGASLNAANKYAGIHDSSRLNYVMLITDGDPNCNDDVNTTTNAAAALFAAGVKTFVIGMTGATTANLARFAQAGGTGSHYMTTNQAQLQAAMTSIAQLATTRPCKNPCGSGNETCNLTTKTWGNCSAPTTCCTDTNVSCDTGLLGICGEGQMKCQNGALTCTQINQKGVETCNGLDDDCDGNIDNDVAPKACQNSCGNNGQSICLMGQWTPCDAAPCCTDTNAPCNTGKPGICADGRMKCVGDTLQCVQTNQPKPDEECNGLDDNCNGEVDEGDPGGGASCDTGLLGQCAPGHLHCKGGMIKCVQDVQAEPEKCDGLDNDCDGNVDNGNPGGGKLCNTGLKGECAKGHTSCVSGELKCLQDKQPTAEVCNGLDDDCDGVIDNGVTNACGTSGPPPKETCNNFDDDCNGKIDDNAECPPTLTCVHGQCVAHCVNNECPGDMICKDTFCVDPCNGVACKATEDCFDGVCSDLCKDKTCKTGEVCRHGNCVPNDCYSAGCDEGKICKKGSCVPDPCAAVTCDPYKEQFCRDGKCVTSCAATSCGFGEKCVDGACTADPCYGVDCDSGQVCDPGTSACINDPCDGKSCGKGKVCVDGGCEDDPCAWITCPKPGEACRMGQCTSGAEQPDGGADGSVDGSRDGEIEGSDGDLDDAAGDGPRDTGKPVVRDAGRDDSGGGTDEDAGGTGGDSDAGGAGDSSGCSCAVVDVTTGGSLGWLALGLAAVAAALRARRRR